MMPPKDGDTIFPAATGSQDESVRQTLHTLSQLLDTGLSSECLDICIRLCECGVNPQALADIVKQIRREAAGLEKSDP
uniref:Mitotic-spindle organizing gamma-tubulin ring associated n=1 Tax=Lutzomyia longipalpis TaxID=7200 RepID=A0A1B0C882_LUTLO